MPVPLRIMLERCENTASVWPCIVTPWVSMRTSQGSRLAWLCPLLVTMSWGMTSTSFAGPADEIIEQPPIIGGQDGKMCAWPSLVMMVVNQPNGQKGVCSGTLVHPKLILYAAHCGSPDQLIFGESLRGATILKEDAVESYKVHPKWRSVSDIVHDVAYVVLKKPLDKVPTIPVFAGCERAQGNKQGRSVRLAGFSSNNSDDGRQVFLRWGENKISGLSGGVAMVTDRGGSAIACAGDSGGPLLFQLEDKSWRTMGITSTLQGGCGQPGAINRYTHINDRIVQWVESNSGVDITPCFDASGQPTPSKACDSLRAYAGNPSAPQGEREDLCITAPTKAAGNFCQVPKSKDDPGEEEGSSSSTGEEDSTDSTSNPDSTTTGERSEDPDETSESTKEEPSDEGSEDTTKSSEEDEESSEDPEQTEPSEKPDSKKNKKGDPVDTDKPATTKPKPKGCQLAQPSTPTRTFGLLGIGLFFGWRRRHKARAAS